LPNIITHWFRAMMGEGREKKKRGQIVHDLEPSLASQVISALFLSERGLSCAQLDRMMKDPHLVPLLVVLPIGLLRGAQDKSHSSTSIFACRRGEMQIKTSHLFRRVSMQCNVLHSFRLLLQSATWHLNLHSSNQEG